MQNHGERQMSLCSISQICLPLLIHLTREKGGASRALLIKPENSDEFSAVRISLTQTEVEEMAPGSSSLSFMVPQICFLKNTEVPLG